MSNERPVRYWRKSCIQRYTFLFIYLLDSPSFHTLVHKYNECLLLLLKGIFDILGNVHQLIFCAAVLFVSWMLVAGSLLVFQLSWKEHSFNHLAQTTELGDWPVAAFLCFVFLIEWWLPFHRSRNFPLFHDELMIRRSFRLDVSFLIMSFEVPSFHMSTFGFSFSMNALHLPWSRLTASNGLCSCVSDTLWSLFGIPALGH